MTIEGTKSHGHSPTLCAGDGGLDLESIFTSRDPAAVGPYILIGALGGFVMAMITVFKKQWAGITAPIYALLEGLFLGESPRLWNSAFPDEFRRWL